MSDQLKLLLNRPPLNGRDGWELVEFTRIVEEEWLDAPEALTGTKRRVGRYRERVRTEVLRFTYENPITRERKTISRDVSNEPNSSVVLPIGFITKARFNALAHEIGYKHALAVLNGVSPSRVA